LWIVGISFIGKERELRIHKRRERFNILRERSMKVGSRTKNGRSHSNPYSPVTSLPFSKLLVREASPPL